MWTWYMTFRCIFSNNGCASNEVKGSVFDHQGVRVIDSSQAISNPIHWGHYKWEHLLPRCMMMARANSRIPLGTMRWPGSWSVCCTTRISPRHSHLWCHWWIDHKKRLTRAHLSHMWWSNNCNITHFFNLSHTEMILNRFWKIKRQYPVPIMQQVGEALEGWEMWSPPQHLEGTIWMC